MIKYVTWLLPAYKQTVKSLMTKSASKQLTMNLYALFSLYYQIIKGIEGKVFIFSQSTFAAKFETYAPEKLIEVFSVTNFPPPRREGIVVWHLSSYPEPS